MSLCIEERVKKKKGRSIELECKQRFEEIFKRIYS